MRSFARTLAWTSMTALLFGCPTSDSAKETGLDTGAGDDDDDDFEPTVPDPLPGGGSEDFSGDITCDAPQSILFDAEASEVIEVFASFAQDGDSAYGSTPSVTLRLGGTEIVRDGNPVNISGAVYVGQPIEGSFLVNLLEAGTYELYYNVFECEPVHFETTLTRTRVPSSNLEMSTATPLEDGIAVAGVYGCGEERWYSLQVDDGDSIQFDLGGVSIVEYEDGMVRGGGGALDLLDSSGQNILSSGNPVSAFHDFNEIQGESSASFTFETGGTYFLKAYYWNGCTISDTYVRYHTL